MPEQPAPTLCPLVAKLYDLDAEITAKQAEFAKVKKDLIAKGEGRYIDDLERNATVVVPTEGSVSFDLYNDAALKAWLEARGLKRCNAGHKILFRAERDAEARKIAGDSFGKLFDRVSLLAPAKAFEDLAPKLLTPARARKLVDLVKTETPAAAAYVRLPDKPKE